MTVTEEKLNFYRKSASAVELRWKHVRAKLKPFPNPFQAFAWHGHSWFPWYIYHSWDVRTFTHEKLQRTSRTTKKYFTYVTRRARSKLNFKYKFRCLLLPTRGTFYFQKLCHFPCPNMVTEDKFPCPRECSMQDHQLNLAPKFKIRMRGHQKDCKRTSAHFSVRQKHHGLSRTNR